jgi:hypothetical protein
VHYAECALNILSLVCGHFFEVVQL